MSAPTLPDRYENVSSTVGTSEGSPPTRRIRSRLTSARRSSRTSPDPSVVRETSGSCITTAMPSAVILTSNSIASAPAWIAVSNAGSVFSAS